MSVFTRAMIWVCVLLAAFSPARLALHHWAHHSEECSQEASSHELLASSCNVTKSCCNHQPDACEEDFPSKYSPEKSCPESSHEACKLCMDLCQAEFVVCPQIEVPIQMADEPLGILPIRLDRVALEAPPHLRGPPVVS